MELGDTKFDIPNDLKVKLVGQSIFRTLWGKYEELRIEVGKTIKTLARKPLEEELDMKNASHDEELHSQGEDNCEGEAENMSECMNEESEEVKLSAAGLRLFCTRSSEDRPNAVE